MSGQQRNDRFADYIPVHERIEKFYGKYPSGRILTSIVEHNAETGFVLVRAEVYREPDDATPAATGHAYELRSAGHVQQGSYVEVGETSAVGRALAMLGFETKKSLAERNTRQAAAPTQIKTAPDGPRNVRPVEPSGSELSMQILQAADALGYDRQKLDKWVNKKFVVTTGLNGLTEEDKREVLKIFNSEVNKKAANG